MLWPFFQNDPGDFQLRPVAFLCDQDELHQQIWKAGRGHSLGAAQLLGLLLHGLLSSTDNAPGMHEKQWRLFRKEVVF